MSADCYLASETDNGWNIRWEGWYYDNGLIKLEDAPDEYRNGNIGPATHLPSLFQIPVIQRMPFWSIRYHADGTAYLQGRHCS